MERTDLISKIPVPKCQLCGESGEYIHIGLTDKLFGTQGDWNFKKCKNTDCGMVWLDPMPSEGDIWKAYRNYHTHNSTEIGDVPLLKMLGYKFTNGLLAKLLRICFIKFTNLQKEIDENLNMYLPTNQPGRLLDVGSGSGEFIGRMHRLGWSAEGVDFDPEAVKHTRVKYGLIAHLGKVEEIEIPPNSFDAITMRHLVEHVYDLGGMIKHCKKLLKPGGLLVITTPNTSSFGHNKFGQNWRGLEPPRHLFLFTLKGLAGYLESLGFNVVRSGTTAANADFILKQSLELEKYGKIFLRIDGSMTELIRSRVLQLYEHSINSPDIGLGEEIYMVCCKAWH
jgi:SAM-dependent methyltransferase